MSQHQPTCPDCRTPVQPTWDWCHACGFDPSNHRPADWMPGLVSVGAVKSTTASATTIDLTASGPMSPRLASYLAPPVDEAQPQEMQDPDWLAPAGRRRLSYLGVVGILVAILIAVGSVVWVTVLVLHRPVGTTQANADALAPSLVVSGRVAAATD